MKRVSLKFLRITSIGIIFSFIFSAFIYINVGATGVNVFSEYIWTQDKEYKAKKYMEDLIETRNKKLNETLNIENVSNYMNDMKLFYDLCVKNDKVEEVEEIMSDYERAQVYYELLLLTGDEELANKYRNDKELNFRFERVI